MKGKQQMNGGTKILVGIVASLFVAMTLGAFNILWTRSNVMELAITVNTQQIAKLEGVVEYLKIQSEQQVAEHKSINETLYLLRLALQERGGKK